MRRGHRADHVGHARRYAVDPRVDVFGTVPYSVHEVGGVSLRLFVDPNFAIKCIVQKGIQGHGGQRVDEKRRDIIWIGGRWKLRKREIGIRPDWLYSAIAIFCGHYGFDLLRSDGAGVVSLNAHPQSAFEYIQLISGGMWN